MEQLTTIAAWRSATAAARGAAHTVGLVPTMGALHAGHRSLIERARGECDVVVVTIFVNPRQFGDANDLAHYPRTLEEDLALCASAGADYVVTPSVDEMWPGWPAPVRTTVSVAGVTALYEGAGRPGHFDGVASVVTKLFAVTGPCRAYFGEKDYQQLAMVRQLSGDLSLGVDVVGCPIVRDDDGLALSSRNRRLTDAGRTRALALSRAIAAVGAAPATRTALQRTLDEHLVEVDVAYADLVDPATVRPIDDDFVGPARAVVAAYVDDVRLLDNGVVHVEAAHALGD